MAASPSGRGWWFVVPVLLFLLIVGIFWPFLDDEAPPAESPAIDSVQVISWEWKSDRSGALFAVYGQVQNLGDRHIKQAVLELRAQDEDGRTLSRHSIVVKEIPAGGKKPFREDIPRTGKESMGFLEVREVIH